MTQANSVQVYVYAVYDALNPCYNITVLYTTLPTEWKPALPPPRPPHHVSLCAGIDFPTPA